MRGNKGEWSELYALFKILGEKELSAGDKDFNKINELSYPVVSVRRNEKDNTVIKFSYSGEDVIVENNNNRLTISSKDFSKVAEKVLQQIKSNTETTFCIPEAENLLKRYGGKTIKAKSSSKTDIEIEIYDTITHTTPLLGFSIKSYLGNAPTLLNASKSTNIIYRVAGGELPKEVIGKINEISGKRKIRERINSILMHNRKIKFAGFDNPIFENNLKVIDSNLPEIMSELLLLFYTTNEKDISKLVAMLTKNNPLNFDLSYGHNFYEYKVKRLLTEIALGMMPATLWCGNIDATGGYLVVKESGDIIVYHIYHRNVFEDYLFFNTRLETPSTSRHGYGSILEEGGNVYFKLNLQIRFIDK